MSKPGQLSERRETLQTKQFVICLMAVCSLCVSQQDCFLSPSNSNVNDLLEWGLGSYPAEENDRAWPWGRGNWWQRHLMPRYIWYSMSHHILGVWWVNAWHEESKDKFWKLPSRMCKAIHLVSPFHSVHIYFGIVGISIDSFGWLYMQGHLLGALWCVLLYSWW